MYPGDDFTLARINNTRKASEGTNLPPRLIGGVRVPLVTGLKIVRAMLFSGGDHIQYTIIWNDANSKNVDHYNLYVNNSSDPKGVFNSPFTVKSSPAILLAIVSPNANSRNIITIQTVLSNGLMSPLSESASVIGGMINFP